MANHTDHLGRRAKVGLILPSVNTVTEPVFYLTAPSGMTFHASRTLITGTGAQDVIDMEKEKVRAAEELLTAKVDCIVDCCTASGIILGLDHDKAFCAQMEKKSGVTTTSTIQLILEALRFLRIKHLVVVTPYPHEVDKLEKAFFEAQGFTIVNIKGLGIKDGFRLATVSASEIYRTCIEAWNPPADGLFVSCMNFNAMPVIRALELALQAPVVSSVSATLWGILHRLRIKEAVYGYGRLLEESL